LDLTLGQYQESIGNVRRAKGGDEYILNIREYKIRSLSDRNILPTIPEVQLWGGTPI